MKNFNHYLTVVQEANSPGGSNNYGRNNRWQTVGNKGIVDDQGNTVFKLKEIQDDYKDSTLKNEWVKMKVKNSTGLGLINYGNVGSDVFTPDGGKTFMYRETPDFEKFVSDNVSAIKTKLKAIEENDSEAINDTKGELGGYLELEKIIKGPAFGKMNLIVKKYTDYSDDYDTVPKSRSFREVAKLLQLKIVTVKK